MIASYQTRELLETLRVFEPIQWQCKERGRSLLHSLYAENGLQESSASDHKQDDCYFNCKCSNRIEDNVHDCIISIFSLLGNCSLLRKWQNCSAPFNLVISRLNVLCTSNCIILVHSSHFNMNAEIQPVVYYRSFLEIDSFLLFQLTVASYQAVVFLETQRKINSGIAGWDLNGKSVQQ